MLARLSQLLSHTAPHSLRRRLLVMLLVTTSILWLLIAWLLVRQIDTMESGISAAVTSSASLERRITTLEHRSDQQQLTKLPPQQPPAKE